MTEERGGFGTRWLSRETPCTEKKQPISRNRRQAAVKRRQRKTTGRWEKVIDTRQKENGKKRLWVENANQEGDTTKFQKRGDRTTNTSTSGEWKRRSKKKKVGGRSLVRCAGKGSLGKGEGGGNFGSTKGEGKKPYLVNVQGDQWVMVSTEKSGTEDAKKFESGGSEKRTVKKQGEVLCQRE